MTRMEEIAEVIKSDVDEKTKCKMISNILTAKPHYFEEQEPCEDAISRKSIIDKLNNRYAFFTKGKNPTNNMKSRMDEIDKCIGKIIDEPSVQTSRKGHWKHFAQSDDCSLCGYSTGKYGNPSNYCPNCGAKMVEPQERSDKE